MLEKTSDLVQNSFKNIIQEIESDLKLNQNFFLCENFFHEQKEIPKKTVKKWHHKKN